MKHGGWTIGINQISLLSFSFNQFIIHNNLAAPDSSGNYTVCAEYRNNCRDKLSSVWSVARKYIWVSGVHVQPAVELLGTHEA